MSAACTSDGLLALLRAKYAPPAFALVTEVPDATSVNKSRSCDAMAFGCWKSAGMVIHGFEIKVSRSDWLKELNDRSKAATFEPFVHHWWIVAAPGIVKLEELPRAWGLMEPSGNGLKVRSGADLRVPQPVSTQMLSAFMRRACSMAPATTELKAARDLGYRECAEKRDKLEQRRKSSESDHDGVWKKAHDQFKASLDAFEAASGIAINSYNGGHVGKEFAAFRTLLNSTARHHIEQVASVAGHMKAAAETLLSALEAVKESTP